MSKSQNLQDNFLNTLRKEHTPVSIFLVNGIKLQGQIESFDQFVVLLKNTVSQMVYKHAISTVVPASEKINSVRVWQAPESTRVVFDLSGPVDHRIFTLNKPNRVVIDLKGTLRTKALFSIDLKDSSIAKVRSAMQNKQDLRVVLDLKKPLKPKSFLLKPNAQYGHRLVLDLEGSVASMKTGAISTSKTVSTATPIKKQQK
mgnify:CR=1 FL=1